jgi:hypothetical protein
MKIPWLTVARVGANVMNTIVPGVAAVEQLAESLGHVTGDQKKQAIVDMVKNSVLVAEGLAAKDLALEPDLDAAVGGIVDAVVHLHNIVAAHKAAAPAGA